MRKYTRNVRLDSPVFETARTSLLRGIYANWIEYEFYRRTRHACIVPTFFTFYGIVNIQNLGTDVNHAEHSEFVQRLWHILSEEDRVAYYKDLHHWNSPSNFKNVRGEIKMCDYGTKGVQSLLEKYGDTLIAELEKEATHP